MAEPRGPIKKSFWMDHLVGYWATEIRKILRKKMVYDFKINEVNSHRAHGEKQIYFIN